MKNSDCYKTASERVSAFWRDYRGLKTPEDVVFGFSNWLELEAKVEEPLPCPFCGATNNIIRETNSTGGWIVRCYTCGHRYMVCKTETRAIAAHNRVARAVARAKEANDENA